MEVEKEKKFVTPFPKFRQTTPRNFSQSLESYNQYTNVKFHQIKSPLTYTYCTGSLCLVYHLKYLVVLVGGTNKILFAKVIQPYN